MENAERKSSKKRRLFIGGAILAGGAIALSGVFAATSISINSGSAISLGAGYTTATTCDGAVSVSATQSYQVNAFKVDSIKVTDIGEAACANKTLTLVTVLSDGSTSTASFSLATISGSAQYIFGQSTGGTSSPYYAASVLASFALDQLSTVAVGIS